MEPSIARQQPNRANSATSSSLEAARHATERSAEIFRQTVGVFVSGKRLHRPRRPKRSKTWQAFQELGISGCLAWLLNDDTVLPAGLARAIGGLGRRSFPSFVETFSALLMRQGTAPNTGRALRAVFHREGWRTLQLLLLWAFGPGTPFFPKEPVTWKTIVNESLVLGHLGFELAWCQHGRHWYFSDRAGRKECVYHRRAGQADRYRRRATARLREVARRATVLKLRR